MASPSLTPAGLSPDDALAARAKAYDSRVRAGAEFLRDLRVREASEAERMAFLERRAGLTREEALDASRLAAAAAAAEPGRGGESSQLWWGAIAAAGAALGGGMALLSSRDSPRWGGEQPLLHTPPPKHAAAVLSHSSHAPLDPAPSPRAAVEASPSQQLESMRQLLAEEEQRHERSAKLLQEQLATLTVGQSAMAGSLERLSTRLDEALATLSARLPEQAARDAASAPATSPARQVASPSASPRGTPPAMPGGTQSNGLRSAHAEMFASATPGSPADLFSLVPPTPASVAGPGVPRLSFAEMISYIQQGLPVPGFLQVDDSPLNGSPLDGCVSTPVSAQTRHARLKPWEREAVSGSGVRNESVTPRITELEEEPGDVAYVPYDRDSVCSGRRSSLDRTEPPSGLHATPATTGAPARRPLSDTSFCLVSVSDYGQS
ncbi:hypothetical protein T492DRAFT_1017445 [Pavlovales sp. CCMP2436]|nr:hypothetical protein T492DRAFT_1017445 [Pavlovales sp. CCMP2436]